jgi:hypothetical protein
MHDYEEHEDDNPLGYSTQMNPGKIEMHIQNSSPHHNLRYRKTSPFPIGL